MVRVLDALDEERPREGELADALIELQDLHEYDRQWGTWPERIAEVAASPYKRGFFLLLRGILRCIEKARGRVRAAAVDLLYSLVIGGCNLTRVKPSFVVECGAIGALCRAARETYDRTTLEVLVEVSRMSPDEMIPSLFEGGAVEVAIGIIEEEDSAPMETLAALDLILSLCKRAPAKTAQSGAFDAVKLVTNEALIPRRNKIMNFLRPIIESRGEVPAGTNIRIGGLKF